MARYDLNEILKNRKQTANAQTEEEMALDDVARVKVLSPGMQVFKRFIRNRLAVFGFILLAIMFLLAFVGPLLYPYGQKQVFYKYDAQNINYAMAQVNSAYNSYDVDADIPVERLIGTAMNSTIKKMIASGEKQTLLLGQDGSYLVEDIGNDVFTLSAAEAELICTVGDSRSKLGTYSSISKTMKFEGDEVDGLVEYLKTGLKGTSGAFELDGVGYTYEKGSETKSYVIYQDVSGVNYAGDPMDAGFEAAAEEAVAESKSFSYGGNDYFLNDLGDASEIYRRGDMKIAKVYTRLTADAYKTGDPFSNELLVETLLTGDQGGKIQADGREWTVTAEDGALIIMDENGEEYGELSEFTVRRYNGEDSMSFELKKAIEEEVVKMVDAGLRETTFTQALPSQTESGGYNYDEDGNIIYADTELHVTQRQVGSYVINCDQIIYQIDRYASPSVKHILGTDGDGFDVFARVMYGGRVSLMVGFVVIFLETLLGVIMGGIAGYYGGWVDNIIMRLVDIFYCLPSLPIMIILGAMMDAVRMDVNLRLWIMMAVLGVLGWAGVARLVRGQILSLREQEFMVATEATGIKVAGRIFRHLIPNVMPQLIVSATMGIGGVIIMESTLSFLGLGVKHPLATWGSMINSVSTASAVAHYPFIWIPIGLLICLTVIAFNFVGDGLRDAYDPKAKR